MKSIASFILASAAIVLAVPAQAQFAKPEDAIKYRQSALTLLLRHLFPLLHQTHYPAFHPACYRGLCSSIWPPLPHQSEGLSSLRTPFGGRSRQIG